MAGSTAPEIVDLTNDPVENTADDSDDIVEVMVRPVPQDANRRLRSRGPIRRSTAHSDDFVEIVRSREFTPQERYERFARQRDMPILAHQNEPPRPHRPPQWRRRYLPGLMDSPHNEWIFREHPEYRRTAADLLLSDWSNWISDEQREELARDQTFEEEHEYHRQFQRRLASERQHAISLREFSVGNEDQLARAIANSLIESDAHKPPDLSALKIPSKPTDTRPGFTRTLKPKQKLACAGCDNELGVGDQSLAGEEARNMSARIYFRGCGHVYCGRCVHLIKINESPFRGCAVVGCKTSRKTKFCQIYH